MSDASSARAEGMFEALDGYPCSYLLQRPAAADLTACFVFAHGAGAGPRHAFMRMVAEALSAHGIATLRFSFPAMERGSRRPDPPRIAQAAVRAAVGEASALLPDAVLIAGGKSFGGRMSAQAHAEQTLPGVRGLAFLGFPLHPAGKPGTERAVSLYATRVPLLFVQGTRDALADAHLLETVVQRLGSRASLAWIDEADHSFRVPARAARRQDASDAHLCEILASWIRRIAAAPSAGSCKAAGP